MPSSSREEPKIKKTLAVAVHCKLYWTLNSEALGCILLAGRKLKTEILVIPTDLEKSYDCMDISRPRGQQSGIMACRSNNSVALWLRMPRGKSRLKEDVKNAKVRRDSDRY
jgi:hypothetical protein